MAHTRYTPITSSVRPSEAKLLQLTVDAMIDSLTVEQRKKLAAFIIRNAKGHVFAYSHGTTKATQNTTSS